MRTLNDIFSVRKLRKSDIARLSNEARAVSIDCGKAGVDKELSPEAWDLFAEISDEIWYSTSSNSQKISLGFQVYEMFPSYYHSLLPFYRGIRYEKIIDSTEKNIIWKHFMKYLASENYYADPVGHVLWVEFFEDETTVRDAWQGLVSNYSDKAALLRLLKYAGPVPFSLKAMQYDALIVDKENHEHIFNSLLYSAHDLYGQIDKEKALNILAKLKIDTQTEKYNLLKEKLK
ncbi:hypothetical protein IC235_12175 [Hymenobacter sp. BT664]|uniref:Uncharacterized protein n=1 Tax=Hymenobacter montanus TaxID=2771359 RepID=A0A927BE73_9BACT|nr:hypothetical protein [Hymenobacter montanus]MBD2768645.1 hypothetical protein [Hymenobacter montanus]